MRITVHVVDLRHGPLDLAALRDAQALELHAETLDEDALAATLGGLRELRGLKALRLRSRVRALPPAVTELRALQRLELSDPELPGLPAAIAELSRLRFLRLHLFHLASLPRSIGSLTRLRELAIDSHHLCGLPDEVRALQDLRALTLLLRHVYVHDWERPAHVPPRFSQRPEDLFALLAGLPALASLTLGEPANSGYPPRVFGRLPDEFAGLSALEELALVDLGHVELPHGAVMPNVRRLATATAQLDATSDELRAVFPNAELSRATR